MALLQKRFLPILTLFVSAILYAHNPTLHKSYTFSQPFSFIENKGQLADQNGRVQKDILYYGHDNGINVYCYKDHIAFEFVKNTLYRKGSRLGLDIILQDKYSTSDSIISSVAKMELWFNNVNTNVSISASNELSHYYNYYLAHCPEGVTAHAFGSITYYNIYKGIDLVLRAQNAGFEYSFIAHPHANISDIRMKWLGADTIAFQNEVQGIKYTNSLGSLTESQLNSYIRNGRNIKCSYRLQGNIVSFDIDRYSREETLIIDPKVIWGTYYADNTYSYGVISNDSIAAYITGKTNSQRMIATRGAFQTLVKGGEDAFLAKFDTSGRLLWGTYFGGRKDDVATGISKDSKGNICIAGYTSSDSGIATKNAFQEHYTIDSTATYYGNLPHAFVAKFSPSGQRLWSTYFSGKLSDAATGISTNSNDDVIIIGNTNEDTVLASPGAYLLRGKSFLASFSNSGSLNFSTYIDGLSANGVAVDTKDQIVITGYRDGFVTSGLLPKKFDSYAYLFKFNSSGNKILTSYFGGNGGDKGYGIVTDDKQDIFIAGVTTSTSGLSTSGAHQTSYSGNGDAFIAKFNSSGTKLWCTYYGGKYYEYAPAITSDANGNVYIAGTTNSDSGIATQGAYAPTYYSLSYLGNGFFAKFSGAGKLDWGSYLYVWDDGIHAITTDKNNYLYLTGDVFGQGFPASKHAYRGIALNGGFLVAFTENPCGFSPEVKGDTTPCQYAPTNYISKDTGYRYYWRPVGGLILSGQNTDSMYVQWRKSGIDTLWMIESSPQGCKDSIAQPIYINPVSADAGNDKTICEGDSVQIGTNLSQPHYIYSWSGIHFTYRSAVKNPYVTPQGSAKYVITATDTSTGCSTTDTVAITVLPAPKFFIGARTTICEGDNLKLGDSTQEGFTYNWSSRPAGLKNITSSVKVSPNVTTTYYLQVSNNKTGCTKNDSVTINVNPLPAAETGGNKNLCFGNSLMLGGKPTTGYSYKWTSKPAGLNTANATPVVSPTQNTMYYLTEMNDSTGCSKTDSALITVLPSPSPSITGPKNICKGQSYNFSTLSRPDTYSWNTLHGHIATVNRSSISINWDTSGSDTVSLTETNGSGCTVTAKVPVTIHELPSAGWKIMSHRGTAFSYMAINPDSANYYWDFGDNSNGKGVAVSHVYATDGTYKVSLSVTDTLGCSSYRDSSLNTLTALEENISGQMQLNIYPDPFTDLTTLYYDLSKAENVSIMLFDAQGKELTKLYSGIQPYGRHSLSINAVEYRISPGIYFLKVLIGDQLYVKRLIKLG